MGAPARTRSVVGAVALAGGLLLAGCGGGTTAATAPAGPSAGAAAWDPPRPAGVSDADWAVYGQDPAAKASAQLAANCRHFTAADAATIGSLVAGAPGSTVEQWTAWFDHMTAYAAPLCAALPAASQPAGGASAPAPAKGLGGKRSTYG